MAQPQDDILKRILADIDSLPPERQLEELEWAISIALDVMDEATLLQLREKFVAIGGGTTLELIDGHIAMRKATGWKK